MALLRLFAVVGMKLRWSNNYIYIVNMKAIKSKEVHFVNLYECGKMYIHLYGGRTVSRVLDGKDERTLKYIHHRNGYAEMVKAAVSLFNRKYIQRGNPVYKPLTPSESRYFERRNFAAIFWN